MLEYIAEQKHQKVFVLGSGGGNDIVSTILLAEDLLARGIAVDIGGILSPRFSHVFNGAAEKVVNPVCPKSTRYTLGKAPIEKPFVDSKLAEVLRQTRSKIGKIWALSLQEGTKGLTHAVEKLVQQERYDAVIGFDVGGDILGRPQDRVLSPIMDMATLTMLSTLNQVPTYIVETGLGADGELTAQQIREVIDQLLNTPNCILARGEMHKNTPAVSAFRELYNTHIRPIRAGNTGRRLLESLEHTQDSGDMEFPYTDEFRVGDMRWESERLAYMPAAYIGKVFVINPKVLARARPGTTPSTDNVVQFHLRIKEAAPKWGSELDGQIVGSLLILTPPTHNTPPPIRDAMLRKGMEMLTTDQVTYCLLHPDDEDYIPEGIQTHVHGHWLIASKESVGHDLLRVLG